MTTPLTREQQRELIAKVRANTAFAAEVEFCDGYAQALTDIEAAEQRERALREMLWFRHGCDVAALYGDDGEMQCSRCMIDFRRNGVEDIRARFTQLGQEQIARALPTPSAPPQGQDG